MIINNKNELFLIILEMNFKKIINICYIVIKNVF